MLLIAPVPPSFSTPGPPPPPPPPAYANVVILAPLYPCLGGPAVPAPPVPPDPPPPPPLPPPAPYDPKEDQLKELAAQHHEMAQENANLKDRLAIKQLPANEDVKAEIEETIGSLRKQVESLERELRSVTLSRNDYQQKNSDLLKQVSYWKRRAEKAEKAA